jgi:hypothetical protein
MSNSGGATGRTRGVEKFMFCYCVIKRVLPLYISLVIHLGRRSAKDTMVISTVEFTDMVEF